MSRVLVLLINGYADHKIGLPTITNQAVTGRRSVRVDHDTWTAATARAQEEGTTMSAVLNTFVAGYGQGAINLPRIEVHYDQDPT